METSNNVTIKFYQLDERATIRKALKDENGKTKKVLNGKDSEGKDKFKTVYGEKETNPDYKTETFSVTVKGTKGLAEKIATAIINAGDLKVNHNKIAKLSFSLSKPCYFAMNNQVVSTDAFMKLRFAKDVSFEEYVLVINKLAAMTGETL